MKRETVDEVKEKAQCRLHTKHAIHVLNGGTSRSFHEIVDRADQDDPGTVFANRDIAEVRSGSVSGSRQMRYRSNKRMRLIVPSKHSRT